MRLFSFPLLLAIVVVLCLMAFGDAVRAGDCQAQCQVQAIAAPVYVPQFVAPVVAAPVYQVAPIQAVQVAPVYGAAVVQPSRQKFVQRSRFAPQRFSPLRRQRNVQRFQSGY